MKTITIATVVALTVAILFAGCTKSARSADPPADSTAAAAGAGAGQKILYWYDPMNPTVHFQHPGKSPFMDMDLQPMYADQNSTNPNVVSVDPAMVQNIGVVTAPVERRTLTRTINTYGVVMPEEKSISDINTRVSGWIEQLYFDYTGLAVRSGQPMAVIYSPELIAAEQEFLQAVGFAATAGSTVTQPEALIKSARERLGFFGMSSQQINELQATGKIIDRVTIHSLHDGVILEKNVYEGQRITSGQTLFKIADLRRVWVLADVFKIDLPFLKAGSPATITYGQGTAYRGRVDFIYPEVDPTARSVKARVPLANPHLAMKVGQYVNVAIHSPVSYSALAVPSQAVINTGLRQVVAVALGEGKFEMRDVKLGPYADGFYAVDDGLTEGETIVTSGQFLIDSDANLKSAGASLAGATPGTDMTGSAQSPGNDRNVEGSMSDSGADQNSRMEH